MLQQNPKAEYGFRDGSVVNVGIKSGTNSIHGTAYAFGRDASATDAANFFTGQGHSGKPGAVWRDGGRADSSRTSSSGSRSFEGLATSTRETATTATAPTSVAMAAAADPTNQLSMVDACNALGSPAKTINPLSAQLAGLNPTTCVVRPPSPTVENIFPYHHQPDNQRFSHRAPSNLPAQQWTLQGRLRPSAPTTI